MPSATSWRQHTDALFGGTTLLLHNKDAITLFYKTLLALEPPERGTTEGRKDTRHDQTAVKYTPRVVLLARLHNQNRELRHAPPV